MSWCLFGVFVLFVWYVWFMMMGDMLLCEVVVWFDVWLLFDWMILL